MRRQLKALKDFMEGFDFIRMAPDNAVIKLGPGKRFEFNYDYCKGCGLCVAECPCGAITMVPEAI